MKKTKFNKQFFDTNVWYEIHTNKSFDKWCVAINNFIDNFGEDAKMFLDNMFEGEDYLNVNTFPSLWLDYINDNDIIYLVSASGIGDWIYDYGQASPDETEYDNIFPPLVSGASGQPGEWWTDEDLRCGGVIV